MKIRWFDVISCVAVLLAAMSGCDNASQVPKKEINQTVQKQNPEAEAVRSFDFAIVDTLMVGDAVFVSEPIPFEIQERMKVVSLPQDARIDISDLRYLTLPYYDFEGQVQQGEMVCNVKIA